MIFSLCCLTSLKNSIHLNCLKQCLENSLTRWFHEIWTSLGDLARALMTSNLLASYSFRWITQCRVHSSQRKKYNKKGT
jgi:hypothetical protein